MCMVCMNINKTKVMRCARDGISKEAAVDPCSVCEKRVGVNSIHCTTCCYWVRGKFRSARKFGKSGAGLCV